MELHSVSLPLAHISETGLRKQLLADHLEHTAALAGEFASTFGAAEEARYAGQLHDLGKDTDGFQKRLRGGPPVDHSTAGAQTAYQQHCLPAAFAIAGHHSGIPDGGYPTDTSDCSTLLGRCKRPLAPLGRWAKSQNPVAAATPGWAVQDNLTISFYTRMLYSCLVDADFIDTETFMDGQAAPRGTGESLPALLDKVRAQAARYLNAPDPSFVQQKRNEILRACLTCGAEKSQGLFTLTVPTGGGKTFASLAFALEHAVAQGMDRIIYVIPYTSIIDQTALVFSDLLGEENVLAHFSGAEFQQLAQEDLSPLQYRQLLASENWDFPVIVTTAVQFFESLYSNRSSRCRKLHNIANSVVIFDEAQTLPIENLMPCLSAIAQLVQHYHTTAVLCTATQPALGPLFQHLAPQQKLTEIAPGPALLCEALRRTTLQDLGTLSPEALSARLSAHTQALCVVNLRKTAQRIFTALPREGSYCLTTLLCPAHRCKQLDEIRDRLKKGLPCRVVSTSLIEAGVDVDFPVAYREQAGLDSILQTAGRCNREGTRPAEESFVYRFCLEGCPAPQMLRANISALGAAIRHYPALDTPAAVHAYFQALYDIQNDLDRHHILEAFQRGISGCLFPFAQVADAFHMIEASTCTIYLPFGEGASLCEKLRRGLFSRSLLRKLGVYSVSCYSEQFDALVSAGALEQIKEDMAILTDISRYDPQTGLALEVKGGNAVFF